MNERITSTVARVCVDNLDDFARMGDIVPIGDITTLEIFIGQHDELIEALRQIALSSRTKIGMKEIARRALGWDPHA